MGFLVCFQSLPARVVTLLGSDSVAIVKETSSIILSIFFFQSQDYSGSVTHPCYPAGYSRTVKLDSVFNSPCTAEYKPSSYDSEASVTLQGSGHYEHCLGHVSEIFSFGSCPFSQCSFDKVFQPNLTGGFMVRGTVSNHEVHFSDRSEQLGLQSEAEDFL